MTWLRFSHKAPWFASATRLTAGGGERRYAAFAAALYSLNIAMAVPPDVTVTLFDLVAPVAGLHTTE